VANAFLKFEQMMFDEVLEGFDDQLVIAKGAEFYTPPSAQDMERGADTIWRPMPYIATSYNGIDQTGNFGDILQMAVPVQVAQHKAVPGLMTSKNLRDKSQLMKFGKAAKQKLASDINLALLQTAALLGSIVSKRTVAASGYDDLADIDALMTEIGVDTNERLAFYSSRDYNKMAGNLAARATMTGKPTNAYEKAYVGEVANIDTYKNDQTYYLNAATAVTVTVNGANQYWVPASSSTDTLGNVTNVDNRFQNLTVTVTSSTIKVGDAFTIAGVNSVHAITKQDTGQLKTFRVTKIVSGAGGSGVIQITPAIISGGGGSRAELMYQNVTATPANGAAITFLNTVKASANPFFKRGALELIPGSFVVDPEDGWMSMSAETELGIKITYTRQGLIDNLNVKYRWDIDFGVGAVNTEMMGIQLFSQT
jgi:hypothetical protein